VRRDPAKQHVASLVAAVAGLGFGASLAAELKVGVVTHLTTSAELFTLLGRVCGMAGTYGIIMTLFLIARIPWLEREVGLDRTLLWHRKLAPYSLLLVGLHVLFILIGYAQQEGTTILGQLWSLTLHTRWILPALVGFILFVTAGVTSYKRARSKMAYETWWVIHVYTYLALALAYAHQVLLGNAFIGHPLVANLWLALTLLAIGSLVVFRWALPIVRGMRYSLRVQSVVQEGPDVVSVWLTGRNLSRMKVQGGQFFCWRFLTKELWWHAHPYSISAKPDGRHLRITVKNLGDHSEALAGLRPGTRVIAEGPYGAFTATRRHGDDVVLIAAGVGITPIRAILEELPPSARVDVLYRVRRDAEIVLREELNQLAQRPHTSVRYLVGSRKDHPLDARALLQLAPNVRHSDVYFCGPEEMRKQIHHAARVLGISETHIHDEAFAY